MKNRASLAKYFAKLKFTKGAEIGVFAGKYSEVLLDTIPDLELFCIDSWRKPSIYKEAIERLNTKNAILVKKASMEAVQEIADKSLDFVFIDADHSYQAVKDDITQWTKKVRIGGIVSGHDYYVFRNTGNRGVIDAVDEFIKQNNYKLKLTRWNKDPNHDERQPSWYFKKTHE